MVSTAGDIFQSHQQQPKQFWMSSGTTLHAPILIAATPSSATASDFSYRIGRIFGSVATAPRLNRTSISMLRSLLESNYPQAISDARAALRRLAPMPKESGLRARRPVIFASEVMLTDPEVSPALMAGGRCGAGDL